MLALSRTSLAAGLRAAAIAAVAIGAATAAPPPAAARVFVGIGLGLPGPVYPGPYYPYYDYPPPAWYPPPPPTDYYPPLPPGPAAAPARISYTNKPGWTDAAGRPCREYKSAQFVGGRATEVYGTACEDPDGQWRVVN